MQRLRLLRRMQWCIIQHCNRPMRMERLSRTNTKEDLDASFYTQELIVKKFLRVTNFFSSSKICGSFTRCTASFVMFGNVVVPIIVPCALMGRNEAVKVHPLIASSLIFNNVISLDILVFLLSPERSGNSIFIFPRHNTSFAQGQRCHMHPASNYKL
ncbi:hypothetical protein CC78DRAFT_26485 [Lojkania enalia]|uniref:Uncharacterized protein n=1 Tax=Lojkania enalia TaxID=147567 RepID=A0A9P4N6B3_9PLEO|nr:hypothetical protein CC78DRAFT_26485 [Didymosphaeria enalia]